MGLFENLEKWKQEGRPIGFSPWRDAEGIAWGVLKKFSRTSITLDEITDLGQPDEEVTYFLSKVSCFDVNREYSERLTRLMQFVPTRPDTSAFIRGRPELRAILEEASRSGEICSVKPRDYGTCTVRVLWLEHPWVEFVEYDGLTKEIGRSMWRISAVTAVRWQTATEEAYEFVERFNLPTSGSSSQNEL